MSDANHYSGEIAIDPPLTWAEIQAGPPVKDIRLKLREETTDTETGRTTVTTAVAVIPREASFGDHQMVEDIQAVVDHYGAAHEFGGHIQAQWDPGYGFTPPQRFLVADGRVQVVTAQVSWPEVSE